MLRLLVQLALFAAGFLPALATDTEFNFNPGTFDVSQLEFFISAHYHSNAAIWSSQLAIAHASYPSVYSVLTSIYNTDTIPDTYDAAFVNHLAHEMHELGPTTITLPTNPVSSDHSNTNTESKSSPKSSGSESHIPTPSSKPSMTKTTSGNDQFTLDTSNTSTAATNAWSSMPLVAVVLAGFLYFF